jgi:hypothetical protein
MKKTKMEMGRAAVSAPPLTPLRPQPRHEGVLPSQSQSDSRSGGKIRTDEKTNTCVVVVSGVCQSVDAGRVDAQQTNSQSQTEPMLT